MNEGLQPTTSVLVACFSSLPSDVKLWYQLYICLLLAQECRWVFFSFLLLFNFFLFSTRGSCNVVEYHFTTSHANVRTAIGSTIQQNYATGQKSATLVHSRILEISPLNRQCALTVKVLILPLTKNAHIIRAKPNSKNSLVITISL